MLCRRAGRILRPAVCSCRALSSPRLDEAERRLQLLYGQDFRATRPEQLYPSHVRTTPVQKLGIACQAALTALRDPHRADMVAALGDATGRLALERLRDRMRADATGRELLRRRPHVTEASLGGLGGLSAMPSGTFGRCYADFMRGHTFSPDERCATRFVDDSELAYVMTRAREMHDFLHVLCGLEPDVPGEIALKWFEMVHTGLPVAAFSAFVGPARLSRADKRVLRRQHIPWAVRAGRRARCLLNVDFEAELLKNRPLKDLQAELLLEPFRTCE